MDDKAEILALHHSYAEKFDARDADAFADLFTDDGVMVPPGIREIAGRERLAKAVRNMPAGGTHLPLEATIEIDGDRANAICQFRATTADGSQHRGTYKDQYIRTIKGWRIVRREVVLDTK